MPLLGFELPTFWTWGGDNDNNNMTTALPLFLNDYTKQFFPPSTVFFWRCIPAFAQSTFTTLFSGTGIESIVDDIVKDIEASWREIIYMCLIALG